METLSQNGVGIYVHIPFCEFLCHYCDFAKTANADRADIERYFTSLNEQTRRWLAWLPREWRGRIDSLYFGGGTPGLFGDEFAPMMETVRPWLRAGAEVTLEANPSDITTERLAVWRQLGVNRLSIGIQTFDPRGLQALTRRHSALQASSALLTARGIFSNVNVDLMFGWEGQTPAAWRHDLARAVELGATHLSLYALTLYGGTPMGRARARKSSGSVEHRDADRWGEACRELARLGFAHEETSNWCLPGYEGRHNHLYWQCAYWLGIGTGAHGCLPDGSLWGLRYAYPESWREMGGVSLPEPDGERPLISDQEFSRRGLSVDRRGAREWLWEYMWTSSRTREGIDLARVERLTGSVFSPVARVTRGLEEGRLRLEARRLVLTEGEWFIGDAWVRDLVDCWKFDR
jgi:oxygen-independent coproporphyrinogen-3 oxidase